MEIAVPSPLTPAFRDCRASTSKALPPTPRKASIPYNSHSAPTSRKASTTGSNLEEERPRAPRFALQNEVLSSKTFLSPPGARSSTSKIPDIVPLRPQLKRDVQTQGAYDLTAREQPSGSLIFTEWKAPKYEYSDDEYGSSVPTSRKASSHGSWAASERTQSAEERARDYTSVLPAFVPEPFYSESGFVPSEMSARITDVFDGALMPAPLVLSGNSEDRKLSSQFSSSDSEVDSLHDESKRSLKSRAKKAFHSRKASQERREKAHADLKLLQHRQASELTTAKHASLQKGIDEMYNTLTGLYSPAKPKMKHNAANSKSNAIGGDLRRQATPVTAHEKSGKKAWDSPKRDDSVGKKLASVFQNGSMAVGFDRGKEQRLKKEE
ncbi:MAG: hypothetical protein Q9161_005669 [Pseudevernia consocians]